jgi:phosphoenolpyruvate-protein phosphotransferase/dihydroxyacetone kinase phosphotransfer subunit
VTDAPAVDPALVGIVVVSHSRTLAEAAVVLAREMIAGSSLRIAVAAGLETTLGTDAVQIAAAIEEADAGGGVVVLMDLGSAVLSAELALDLLSDPAAGERVVLSAAPLVEGLVAAVVAAAGGADRVQVAAEAQAALEGKRAQLGPSSGPSASAGSSAGPAETPPESTATGRFSVLNPHGLHARPAARLVAAIQPLDAVVQLRNLSTGAGPVPAASMSKLATLGAAAGHEIEVSAAGAAAQQAVDVVLALAARRFDEPGFPPDGAAPNRSPAGPPTARGASPGIAIGPVRHLRLQPVEVPVDPAGTPDEEGGRLTAALAAVRADLRRLAADASVGTAGDIFAAQQLLLDDPELVEPARQGIAAGQSAPAAWAAAVAAAAGGVAGLADEYLRARGGDVPAVGDQVLRAMTGGNAAVLAGAGVLVAGDLTPAQTAELDLDRVRGLLLAEGSPTSHAAILARARELPAVVGAGPSVLDIAAGTVVILDGATGTVVVDPAPTVLADYRRRAAELAARRASQRLAAQQRAVTRDGIEVLVAANLGSRADARSACAAGADAAGLVRTEFLFLGRSQPPDVDEQVAEYRALAEAMGGRRLTFRTLDVGGDKPLPYLPMPVEDNPMLGVRGIRLALASPTLLRNQLLALCRVAREGPVSIMFPMISGLEELVAARRALDEAAGAELPSGLEVGIMVEVPAAALKVTSLLPNVDFLSIGTNDLTQYTLAADRGNGALAALADPLDPGVLALIGRVCAAAAGRVPVAVCGEAAADLVAVPVLLGLGVRELSVAAPAVPAVKDAIRRLDLGACQQLARKTNAMTAAAEVRRAAAVISGAE